MKKTKQSKKVDQLIPRPFTQPLAKIRGAVKPPRELKYVDIASAGYEASTTGTITALNLIAEGDDNINREGRAALMVDCSVNGFLQVSATTAANGAQGRLLLVWDNAANGAIATIANVLTALTVSSYPNVDNIGRFTILADRRYVVGSAIATQSSIPIVGVEETVRVNSVTRFSGTTAAIGSMQNGVLLMITLGSVGTGATAPNFALSTRVTFHDVQ